MDDVLKKLRERTKRTVLRKIETGEVTYDQKKKIFKYKDTEEEYKIGQKGDGSDDDDEESDSEGSVDHANNDANSDSEDDEQILKKLEMEK